MFLQVKYHVTFFEDDIRHAWLNPKDIKAFVKYKKSTLVKKVSYYKYAFTYLKIVFTKSIIYKKY